ncbi:MAG: DUF6011 domain-containing protein [Vicinamibacterales bacterium]
MTMYRWVYDDSRTMLRDVGIRDDGTLVNPHGYPEAQVRAAVLAADRRRHERRSKAATQAAVTRRERQEVKVYQAAQRIVQGHRYGPRVNCVICRYGLDDPQSIERGIGPDCWQSVLAELAKRARNTPGAGP